MQFADISFFIISWFCWHVFSNSFLCFSSHCVFFNFFFFLNSYASCSRLYFSNTALTVYYTPILCDMLIHIFLLCPLCSIFPVILLFCNSSESIALCHLPNLFIEFYLHLCLVMVDIVNKAVFLLEKLLGLSAKGFVD